MTVLQRYTVKRYDGFYPDSSYDSKFVNHGIVTTDLGRAKLWNGMKWADTYRQKFGGKVVEVRVVYEEVSL